MAEASKTDARLTLRSNPLQGLLAIEPHYYASMLALLDVVGPKALQPIEAAAGLSDESPLMTRVGRIALVHIGGPLSKNESPMGWMFGGTSTTAVQEELARLATDDSIDGVTLVVDSPGGSVAGTAPLGDAIHAFPKPISAFVDGMAASAALWLASQADHVVVEKTALVGSIGVIWGNMDVSEAYAREGVRPVVITSDNKSGIKGSFFPGTRVTPQQEAHIQGIVDDTADQFVRAVARGRKMSLDATRKLADARLHVGQKAVAVGLADAVGTLDDAIAAAGKRGKRKSDPENPKSEAGTVILMQTTASGIGANAPITASTTATIYPISTSASDAAAASSVSITEPGIVGEAASEVAEHETLPSNTNPSPPPTGSTMPADLEALAKETAEQKLALAKLAKDGEETSAVLKSIAKSLADREEREAKAANERLASRRAALVEAKLATAEEAALLPETAITVLERTMRARTSIPMGRAAPRGPTVDPAAEVQVIPGFEAKSKAEMAQQKKDYAKRMAARTDVDLGPLRTKGVS